MLFWLKLDTSLHEWGQPSVLGSVSTFVWLLESTWCLLLQETKPTVLTKFDEKGYLRETHFRKQCLSLIGGIKELEIMIAEFVSAVSNSTHFSVSDLCRWKWCATNIITYSFEYNNNNKKLFLSPYNALALKTDLSSTILDAYCYCYAFWNCLFFVMMNMTEKCPTFGAIFHLHFQILKNILKQSWQIFAKQILWWCA